MNKGTGYLSWLRSKDTVIINLLEEQAALAAKATTTLVDLSTTVATNPEQSKRYQSQIRDLEHDGNQIVRKLFLTIDETFVTPIDREDISRISQAIEKISNNIRRIGDNINYLILESSLQIYYDSWQYYETYLRMCLIRFLK